MIMNMLFWKIVFNSMKRAGTYIIAGLLFFAVSSEAASAVENYISPATTPPSVRREGLVRSPNPANTGNQLVTGNVRGGDYFRGSVPYRSPSDFGTTLPSSSLDSFMRDSVGAEDLGRYNRYTLGYSPYYSPTQAVTSAIPRTSALATSINAYSVQSYLSGNLPQRRDEVLDSASAVSLGRLRPMSMTPEEMQKLISSEMAKDSPGRLTQQQYQQQPKQLGPDLKQQSDAGLKKMPTSFLNEQLLKPVDGNIPADSKMALTKEGRLGEENAETMFTATSPRSLDKQLDVYEQMKQQINTLEKEIQRTQSSPQPEKPAVSSAAGKEDKKSSKEGQKQELSQAEKLAETDLSAARTENILGTYETFASYSDDKFNQNMRAGEFYLKQGKYYRAADAYTLASLYKPGDPLAYAGKSHALFASGEYMSSALFLSRALNIFPEYVRFKIDLVAMVGDKDKLESRIVDVEEWLGKSNAPELQFLLAYVYYQMDRFDKAKESIEEAYKMMPQDSAVLALKKVIEESAPGPADEAKFVPSDSQSIIKVEGQSK